MAALGPHTQGFGAITERPHGEHPVLHATCLDRVPVRPSEFQGPPSASPLVPAPFVFCNFGVASHLIHVVTTGELALTQGFLVAVGSRWKVALHESAERVNVRVHDLDLHPGPRADNRRQEVVADGLPLFHGAQLAVDTTTVSTVRADGVLRRAERDGAALDQARRTKERTYPELTGEQGWAQEEGGLRRPNHSSDTWRVRGNGWADENVQWAQEWKVECDKELLEAEERLARMRVEVETPTAPVPDPATEVQRPQHQLAQAQVQHLQHGCTLVTAGSTAKRPRRREDFVCSCTEEVIEWMSDRQMDI